MMTKNTDCPHNSTTDVGFERDGAVIVKCDECGEMWNEGVA